MIRSRSILLATVTAVGIALLLPAAPLRGEQLAASATPRYRRGATADLGKPIVVDPKFRAGLVGTTIAAPRNATDGGHTRTPSFDIFLPPEGMAMSAGEPSIGANWNTGNLMFQAYVETDRVTIDDSVSPPKATWTDVSSPNGVVSLDPILFTDPISGRTAVSQLVSSLLVPGGGCSIAAVTPDDGATWLPSTGCGVPGAFDHQTIAGGPYADPASHPQKIEDRAMYYCGQNGYFANCALSTDGGVTYGAGVPTYTDLDNPQADSNLPTGNCMGLHGHLKVGPDGTLYLPNFGCAGPEGDKRVQGVVVSEDDGVTWDVRTVPNAFYNDFKSDPSVAIARNNTVYFTYEPKKGAPQVVISKDKGETWTNPVTLGKDLGIKHGVFPAAVAGDGDRAAVAFIGTTDEAKTKDSYEDKDYAGAWHLYLSSTYDGGKTWKTVDITGSDPVQRGCIWWGNGTCPSAHRNLLDFMDATLDKFGRIVIGYADGCMGPCIKSAKVNPLSDVGAIARQASGLSMFSKYDAKFSKR